MRSLLFFFFFFNDTATTEIYTLSLHDALPISDCRENRKRRMDGLEYVRSCATLSRYIGRHRFRCALRAGKLAVAQPQDRKSTRLNSSHLVISYAVFCLKKKK